MRKATALLVIALATGVAAAGAGTRAPAVSLTLVPLTVRGSDFAPQERVRVKLAVGPRRPLARAARADRDGRFAVRFAALLALDPCEGTVVVTATGDRGSRATARKPCRPPSRRPG